MPQHRGEVHGGLRGADDRDRHAFPRRLQGGIGHAVDHHRVHALALGLDDACHRSPVRKRWSRRRSRIDPGPVRVAERLILRPAVSSAARSSLRRKPAVVIGVIRRTWTLMGLLSQADVARMDKPQWDAASIS